MSTLIRYHEVLRRVNLLEIHVSFESLLHRILDSWTGSIKSQCRSKSERQKAHGSPSKGG